MRLIDADAVISAYCEGCKGKKTGECAYNDACVLVGLIEEAPTIEAAPVRHEKAIPHIIQIRNTAGKVVLEYQEGWECPFCGDPGVKNYCQNCGAKIDKEG